MRTIQKACEALKLALVRRPRRNTITRPRRLVIARPDAVAADLIADYARRFGISTGDALAALVRKAVIA